MLDILSKMFTLDGKGHLLPLLWLMTAGLLLRMAPGYGIYQAEYQ